MIVIDASAWVDLMTATDPRSSLLDALGVDAHWVVPEHFRAEAMNALRDRWLGGSIDSETLVDSAVDLSSRGFDVWPTAPLIPRMVELSRSATSYDAAYIALAEELGCTLVTSDARLGRIPGIRCRVVGFE